MHKCKNVTHHFQNLVAGFKKGGKGWWENPPRLYTTEFLLTVHVYITEFIYRSCLQFRSKLNTSATLILSQASPICRLFQRSSTLCTLSPLVVLSHLTQLCVKLFTQARANKFSCHFPPIDDNLPFHVWSQKWWSTHPLF